MAVFQYEGRDKTGKRKQEKLTLTTEKKRIVKLRETGIAVFGSMS